MQRQCKGQGQQKIQSRSFHARAIGASQREVICDADRPEIIGASVLRIIPPDLHSDEPIILAKIRAGQAPMWNFHGPVRATTEWSSAMRVAGGADGKLCE
jgi:hypothetical protein